jgi:hypothetical protein
MNVDLDLYAISGDFSFLCAALGLCDDSKIDYLETSSYPSIYPDETRYCDAWIAHRLCTSDHTIAWCVPHYQQGNVKRRIEAITDQIGHRRGRLLIRSTGPYSVVGMTFDIAVAQRCNLAVKKNLMARSNQMITIV